MSVLWCGRHPLSPDSSSWGYCPDHLIDRKQECGENYERIDDICVRVSPYKLKWEDAEAKCQTEGAHLIHIMSATIQKGVEKLIKKLQITKSFFENGKWTTDEIEAYWTGGMVSLFLYQKHQQKRKSTTVNICQKLTKT